MKVNGIFVPILQKSTCLQVLFSIFEVFLSVNGGVATRIISVKERLKILSVF